MTLTSQHGSGLALYVPPDPVTKDDRAALNWLDVANVTAVRGRRRLMQKDRDRFSYVHVDFEKLPKRLHAKARIVRGIGREDVGQPMWAIRNRREVAGDITRLAALPIALTAVALVVRGPISEWWLSGVWSYVVAVAAGIVVLAWIVLAISARKASAECVRIGNAVTVITPTTLGEGVLGMPPPRERRLGLRQPLSRRRDLLLVKTEESAEVQEVTRATRAARAIAASTAWKSGYLDAQRVRLDLQEETRQIAWQCQQIYDLRRELGSGDGGTLSAATGVTKTASEVRAGQRRQLDGALDSVHQRVDALVSYAKHIASLDVELAALRELERTDSLADRIDVVVARGSAANELATSELEQLRDQLAAAQASVRELVQLLRGDVAILQPIDRPESH